MMQAIPLQQPTNIMLLKPQPNVRNGPTFNTVHDKKDIEWGSHERVAHSVAPFNMSETFSSTYASSSCCRSETSTSEQFLPYGQAAFG